jgi:DNA-binding NtrC family response regulator
MAEILVVDDDENISSAFRQFLQAEGHRPIIVSNAIDALEAVRKQHPDMIFMDLRMPGIDGLEALKRVRESDPNAYVVIMTAYSTSQTSIEAIRSGAFDYLHKPLDLGDVRHVIDKALTAQKLSRKAAARGTDQWDQYSLVNLVGKSARMQEVYKLIGLLTTNDVPVFITGKRGTGKQLVARTIHFNSGRKDHPFITISCEILPAETMELEIFGRSAQSGSPRYVGRLERANHGTLFIDEVQHLPLSAQHKLLRYLKEKTYEPIGETAPSPADVRIIAASSEDFGQPVNQALSHELYETLGLITIELPRLSDRREDIPELVSHFIRRHNDELHKNIKGIDERGIERLQDYGWPGNVAELENVIKRACILSRGDVITVGDVQDAFEGSASPSVQRVQSTLEAAAREALQQRLVDAETKEGSSVFHDIVSQVETALVQEALRITGGNQVQAADRLGLNRATLRKKMNPESTDHEERS